MLEARAKTFGVLALVLAACASSAKSGMTDNGSAASTSPRDWTRYPAITQVDGRSELWVLSDVHGDYAALTKLLGAAHVISGSPPTWSAGTAALIVVGDSIDKGPAAPEVVRFWASLETSAASMGGQVIVTMGNHEAEFLADPTNAKASASDGFDPELQSIGLSPEKTAAGEDDIGVFLHDLPFAARVDDWFFVHAGNTGGKAIADLAVALQTGVDANGFGATILSATDSLLEDHPSNNGPQWWDATHNPAALLQQWTTALGAQHLVMGHEPAAFAFADGTTRAQDEMMQAYGARLFFVDTGMSVGSDNTGGALLHITGANTPAEKWEEIRPNGSVSALASHP